MFFKKHPEFLETSGTSSSRGRLNLRYLAIIDANREILKGRRVLDIASHDGRWSFAALHAGAAHVTAIEGRQHLVDNARRTFAAKGIDSDRYTILCGDVHEELNRSSIKVDTVMCLGFLYHTSRYAELMTGIRATGADDLIVDCNVMPDEPRAVVRLRGENNARDALAVEDKYSNIDRTLTGIPSAAAITMILNVFGFKVIDRTDWDALLAKHPRVKAVEQYRNGERVTLRARRVN